MLRRILIPLDPSSYADSALEYGCFFAKRYHAEITGLAVLDILGIEDNLGPMPMPGVYRSLKLLESMDKDALEHIDGLLGKFVQKCEEEKVLHQEAKHQGIPSKGILDESIFYDLLIVGMNTFFDFEADGRSGKSLNRILDHSITPIFAVPDRFIWHEEPIKTLIAFNGSLPAARAIRRFMRLMKDVETEVILLMSDKDEDKAKHYLSGAEVLMRAHSMHNIKTEWVTQNIISAVEERYLDWADLVVAGAYSKRGLVDFMVGSLAKFLIESAKKPILFGQ